MKYYNLTEQTDMLLYLSRFFTLSTDVLTKLAIAVLRHSHQTNKVRYSAQSDTIYVNDRQINVESWLTSNCKQCAICQQWFEASDPYFFDYYIQSNKKNEDIEFQVCGGCDSHGAENIIDYLTQKNGRFRY